MFEIVILVASLIGFAVILTCVAQAINLLVAYQRRLEWNFIAETAIIAWGYVFDHERANGHEPTYRPTSAQLEMARRFVIDVVGKRVSDDVIYRALYSGFCAIRPLKPSLRHRLEDEIGGGWWQ